jgi:hypothetical protein
MRTLVAKLALCGLALAAAAQARGQVTVQYVDFPKGYEGRTYTRAVKGEDACDYLVRNVEDDQKLDVTISSNNESVFFDVFDRRARIPGSRAGRMASTSRAGSPAAERSRFASTSATTSPRATRPRTTR